MVVVLSVGATDEVSHSIDPLNVKAHSLVDAWEPAIGTAIVAGKL